MSENSGRKQGVAGSEQGRNRDATRFKPGQSGNPAGKPKGARHRATVMTEQLMAKDAKAIVQSVVDKAKGGDMVAARLVLDRIAPLRKGRAVEFDLPSMDSSADVANALGALIAAAAKAELTPEEAAAMAGVLEIKRKAIETADLEQRVAALEKGIPK